MGKKGGKKSPSKLKALKNALEQAEASLQAKEGEVRNLQQAISTARAELNDMQNEVESDQRLEQSVQLLLRAQQEAASAFNDYENRVLALELQGLVERYRMMDVESLVDQNHELRSEVMRLQQENMELSRAVADGSVRARSDLARIQLALEVTAREQLAAARERIQKELYDRMDDKTRRLVDEHGALQDAMLNLAKQAEALDQQYRALSTQRLQFKVDAEVGASMSEMQAKQVVVLRHQLDHAFIINQLLQAKLEEEAVRADSATADALRVGRTAANLSKQVQALKHRLQHGEGLEHGDMADGTDSAFHMDGADGSDPLEAEVTTLRQQVLHFKERFARARGQRDKWKDRSLMYERACAQLQAALQTLQDQSKLALPNGFQQSMESIWSADPKHAPLSTPHSPLSMSAAATPRSSRPGSASPGLGGMGSGLKASLPLPLSPRPLSYIPGAGGRPMSARPGSAYGGGAAAWAARPSTAPSHRSVSPSPQASSGAAGPGMPPSAAQQAETTARAGAVASAAGDLQEQQQQAGSDGAGLGVAGGVSEEVVQDTGDSSSEGPGTPRASTSPLRDLGVSRLYSLDAEPLQVMYGRSVGGGGMNGAPRPSSAIMPRQKHAGAPRYMQSPVADPFMLQATAGLPSSSPGGSAGRGGLRPGSAIPSGAPRSSYLSGSHVLGTAVSAALAGSLAGTSNVSGLAYGGMAGGAGGAVGGDGWPMSAAAASGQNRSAWQAAAAQHQGGAGAWTSVVGAGPGPGPGGTTGAGRDSLSELDLHGSLHSADALGPSQTQPQPAVPAYRTFAAKGGFRSKPGQEHKNTPDVMFRSGPPASPRK